MLPPLLYRWGNKNIQRDGAGVGLGDPHETYFVYASNPSTRDRAWQFRAVVATTPRLDALQRVQLAAD